MNSWHLSLFSHWYVVARSDQLGQKPMAVELLGQRIALMRMETGVVMALEDRCPHRHAPLSAGCRKESGIACPYHGWTFGADGVLQAIPGMPPEVPLPQVRVRQFCIREHDGLVWLRLSTTGDAEPAMLVRNLKPQNRRFLWQTRWATHVVDAMENFLDPMHTHQIHAGLVRREGARQRTLATFKATEEGFQVDYSTRDQSGFLYRIFESRRTLERAHFAAPGTAQIEYRYASGSSIRITLHFAPRSSTETDVFASLHVEGRWAPAWAVRLLLWPMLRRVAEQDRRILELQSENMQRFNERHGASTQLDIVRSHLESFWAGNGKMLPSRTNRDVEMML